MGTWISYPYAKVNVGLTVGTKRADGYHDLETLFVPVPHLCDILEITLPSRALDATHLFLYGLPVEGDPQDNLCMKAYRMLAADFDLPCVEMHLYKQIPTGSGLGGGSSDAACCLNMLNTHFGLHLSPTDLAAYALRLGSDVPFFLQDLPPMPFLAHGRGQLLTPFPLDLSRYKIVLRFPEVKIPTASAYQWWDQRAQVSRTTSPLATLLKQPLAQWKNLIVNDFEEVILDRYPQIQETKMRLYQEGAVYASMTGSGSAVFGIFENSCTFVP